MANKYKAIGLMSGTSVDGLDIAYCEFTFDGAWNYSVGCAETIPYEPEWRDRLSRITEISALDLALTHVELGKLFGDNVKRFIQKHGVHPDLVASHGHTVFHQPEKGLTLQIGSGYEIMNACRITVVNDFRSLDVALGGQGAPLAPMGDLKLFHQYDFCINLGGISNISFNRQNTRLAYDIAPNNLALNRLARRLGYDYDPQGELSRKGKIIAHLLEALNGLDYYKKPFPKSLGIEYIAEKVFPLLDAAGASEYDLLTTFCHHIACQIDKAVKEAMEPGRAGRPKALITGGGAYHLFLLELLEHYSKGAYEVIVPGDLLINFKEALIFAFLGVLRVRNEVNALSSFTGAKENSCGGIIFDRLPGPAGPN